MPRYLIWLTIGAFAVGTEGFMIAGLLPLMAADLHVSLSLSGQLVTVFALAYAIGSPVLAVATGNLNRKLLLVLAIGLFGAANLLAALAPTFTLLMSARVILALCAGAFMPAASGYAVMSVAPELRGRALASILSGITIALIIGTPLGTAVGQHLSWRATFVGVALASGITALGIAFVFPARANTTVVGLRDRLALAMRPDVLTVLILTVFSVMGGFTIYPYLAEMLNQIAGYHGDAITAVLLLLGLGGTAGNFFGGYASDMWDIRRLLLCLLALLAADYALLSVSGESGLPSRIAGPLAAVVVFLWGLISWAIPVAQQARMVRLAGALAPIALSLNQSALYLGIAAGSALGSVMVAFGSVKALGFAGAACAGVGFLWLAIPMRSANADARDALS